MRQIVRFILIAAALAGLTPAHAGPETQGTWLRVNDLPFFPVHVHVLPTGKVMFWPGDGGVSGNDPRLWDPANQNVTPLAKPGFDTFCTGHTFLADGRLFVAGGHIVNGEGLPKASAYDPSTNTWSAFPDMNAGRWYPTATVLGNGDVLVVSGSIDNVVGANKLPQVFQLGSNTWRGLTNAQLGQDLYPMMLLAPNGKVFNPGPDAATRYLDTSGTGKWEPLLPNRAGGYRGYGSAVMYAPGKILVMGGGDPPTDTAEVIDLNQTSPAWRPVGSMTFARRQLNALLLPDGNVLVTGGTSGAGFNNTDPTLSVYAAELWNPATESFSVMASASIPRLYHSATVLLPDGRVLSTGGNGHRETEIYSPPYLFNGARPMIASAPAPASVGYGQSFFVETSDAAAITNVRMIRLSSTTHAFNMGQHLAELDFSPASGGISATTPANGNLAPPGYYLLFILNGAGVPSMGEIMQLTSSAPPPPPPGPSLTSLQPNSATAGGLAFTLTVNGANFVNGASVVRWNGANHTTSFVSATQLTAAIPASDIAQAGTAQVTVANGSTVSNALTFTITNPAPSSFNLTVSKSGPGTVTSSPAGINCGSDCSEAYSPNTIVTLTATPSRATFVVGWSGACGGTNPVCTVTMDASKSVSARFSKK